MRRWIAIACLGLGACASSLIGPRRLQAQTLTVTPRGSMNLAASTTDQNGATFNLSGLSGVTHVAGGTFWAVMDNSNKLVQLQIAFGANGNLTSANVIKGLSLAQSSDFEGVGYTNTIRNSVFVSEETTPGIREYNLATGALLQMVTPPAVFANRRPGFGLESLSYRLAGTDMWTANEEALNGDGPLSTTTAGTLVRLQHFNVSDNDVTPAAQFVYQTDAIHGGANDVARSGVSDMVVLPDGKILVLERSFASSLTPYQSRIYELDFSNSPTDVSGITALNGQTFTSVTKHLLWKGQAGGLFGQNLEGLALGPQLSNGNYALLGIIDDGGEADPLSNNAVVSFEITGVSIPEPTTLGVTLPLTGWWFTKLWRRR